MSTIYIIFIHIRWRRCNIKLTENYPSEVLVTLILALAWLRRWRIVPVCRITLYKQTQSQLATVSQGETNWPARVFCK